MGLRDLNLRIRSLFAPRQAERDLHDEMAFHIECETRKLIGQGMAPNQARVRARARFGSAAAVADECRDQRGTAFVDNTLRDVRFSLRSFRRAPLTAFTIVATVATGLGVVAVLFTILNAFLFRADAVPRINEIFAVERPDQASAEKPLFTRPSFEALRRETSVFADVYAAVPGIAMRLDGRMMAATLVTSSFFDVVRVNPVMGRALRPAEDAGGVNPVLVLSDKGWTRHFNRDPNVLGRQVLVGGSRFEIVGVMPSGFRGLEVRAPDAWAPLAQLAQFRPADRGREDIVGVNVVGRLQAGVPVERARAEIAAWNANQQAGTTTGRGEIIALVPQRGTIPPSTQAFAVFTPLFFAFGLILMIGCANVANLLLARGMARQREIGVRLSLGASRRRIIRQLMTESLLLALAAAGGGYLLSRITLRVVVYWAARMMPVDLGDPNLDIAVPAADWRVSAFLVTSALAATAFFALAPALRATRVDPLRTLRGEGTRETRSGRGRNVLIGMQVFASAVLLICSTIFLRSALASSRFDPGFRTADTVVIDIVNEAKRGPMVQAIASESAVSAYAAMRPGMLGVPFAGIATIGLNRTPVAYKLVSPEYFDVFDVPIARGRSFTPTEQDGDHPVVIVSESIARQLWPAGGGVGETFRLEADAGPSPRGEAPIPARLVTVIGVARDVAGFRFIDSNDAGIYLPTNVNAPNTSVAARLAGDSGLAYRTLVDRLTRVDPNTGTVVTMRTLASLETSFLQVAFWVSLVLGGLALLLTVSGLFSVLSYLVEQRTREIGVRMALGASPRKVTALVLAQTARPVLYGLLAGAGLAGTLATILIATPGAATITEIVHVGDPVAYAASLAAIVAACLLAAWIPAARAARLDPMRTLRQE